MKEISATEAARGFATLLDAVEHDGESFVIRRNGRRVASVAPVPVATGRVVKDLLRRAPVDPGWLEELRELRGSMPVVTSAWDD